MMSGIETDSKNDIVLEITTRTIQRVTAVDHRTVCETTVVTCMSGAYGLDSVYFEEITV